MIKSDRIIKHKLSKCEGINEYSGYITPVEVLRCIELGFDLAAAWRMPYILFNKKTGISNPSWVYFRSNKKIMEFMK